MNEEMNSIFIMDYPTTYYVDDSTACRYNTAVSCSDKSECNKCGWNPVVDMKRRPKTRERLRKAGWLDSE